MRTQYGVPFLEFIAKAGNLGVATLVLLLAPFSFSQTSLGGQSLTNSRTGVGGLTQFITYPFEMEFHRGYEKMAMPSALDIVLTPEQIQESNLPPRLASARIEVSTAVEFQKIFGYGAALTEASVVNILKLQPQQQEEILNLLFHPAHGGGLNLIRVPMGSSDLADGAKGEYTYNDTPEQLPDPELKHFSMERDVKTLQLLQRILTINPQIQVMINPWTAPPWMKENRSYYRGYFDSRHLKSFVEYFIRTIKEYHKYGIEVYYVGIQNEPGISIDYPSMLMHDEQQEEMIKALGARLRQEGFVAQVVANDDNYVAMPRVHRFINNPEVAQHIGVAGFHCWSNDPERVRELPRHVVTFETECGGNIRSHNYGYDFYWWLNKRVIDNANNGLSGVIAWNMVSDENAGPHGAGPQGCRTCRGLVTVRPTSAEVIAQGGAPYYLHVNSEFRALMHASKYVKRGAVRVDSALKVEGEGAEVLSHVVFKNPEGSLVVIVGNSGDREQSIDVVIDGRSRIYQKLSAGEAQTIVVWP